MERSEPLRQKQARAAHVDGLVAGAAVVLALSIVLAVTWTLGQIELQLKQQVEASLRSVVATTRAGIALWRDGIEAEISVLAQSPELVAAVETALADPLAASIAILPIARLQAVSNPVAYGYGYTGFAVVRPDGFRVASSEPNRSPAALHVDMDLIEAALSGEVTVRLRTSAAAGVQPLLVAAAPVRDRASRVVAALVLFLDPMASLTTMTRLGRPGASGETYVFARDGRILTRSRFPRAAGLASPIPSDSARELRFPQVRDADRREAPPTSSEIWANVEGYSDYRGIDVFGAWLWDDRLGIGVATEVDSREAMGPYRSIRTLTLSMSAAVAVSLLTLLAMLVSRERGYARTYAFMQAAKARTEVLAMVSHDLRSPLHNVLLCSDMIAAGCRTEALSTIASSIRRSGLQMDRLIADLLDVSEIEAGRFDIEKKPCEVRVLLEDVRDIFAEDARAKQIALAVDCPRDVSLRADAGRIAQVLTNLVGNAVKFTPPGGTVSVQATPHAAGVRFEVRDTGPGIAEAELPYIFDQFWRAKTSAKKTGKGLGLYIAKMLVDAHGGRIWAETNVRAGTAFCFTIPR